MRLFKICLIALVALFSTTFVAEAQQRSTRYTLGDVSNNEIADSVDFDLNAPVLTEGDGKLYHIRKINLHGVKYLNHDILKSSAGLQEGDSVYLPSKFISNAMTRLWAPRYFSDIQIGATIEGDSVDLEVFLKERARILNWTITGVSKSKAKDLQEEVLKLRRNTELSDYVIDKNIKLIKEHYDPAKAEKLISIAKDGLADIVKNGVAQEYVSKAKESFLKSFPERQISNGYWMSVIYNYYGLDKDINSEYVETVEKCVTSKNIQKLLKKMIKQGNMVKIVMNPKQ